MKSVWEELGVMIDDLVEDVEWCENSDEEILERLKKMKVLLEKGSEEISRYIYRIGE